MNLAKDLKPRRRWKPWMTRTAIGVSAVILFLGLAALYYAPKARAALAAGRAAAETAKQVPADLSSQKFEDASGHVKKAVDQLAIVRSEFDRMQGLRWWPYVGRQYRAIDALLDVGNGSAGAMDSLIQFLRDVFKPFEGRGKVSLATISANEKWTLLKNIHERGDDLRQAQDEIHRAAEALAKIPRRGLLPPLASVIDSLRDQFPLLTEALDEAIPATKVFPTILGYPNEKNYLFLLENNTELRPGGGFIGTYGLMKVKSGEIVSLKTDNVYNLDRHAGRSPAVKPPAPLARYLGVPRWYFRDSNWSPDFPTTAAQALYLYEREGGAKGTDGVIAVTPTAIADLIALTGPITVDGIRFTADNFVDTLQYQVEKGFLRAGLAPSERKDIIGDLTEALMSRLLNLPLPEWKDLFLTMSNNLEGKQILIWLSDVQSQNIMVSQNWAGAVDQRTGTDYLMIVDANVASLKTDQVMLRKYDYRVVPDKDGAVAELTIKYQNTGKFDWKTTRYNTFVRAYVPYGSQLLESRGAQVRERSAQVGKIETTTELGKTVFSTFKSIEPGQTGELYLKYRLPAGVAQLLTSSEYVLVWQKQPGMLPPDINLAVESEKNPTAIGGVDNLGRVGSKVASFSGRLRFDRTVTVNY